MVLISQSAADFSTLISIAQGMPLASMLIFVVIAYTKGWVHSDREFKAVEKREAEWRELALKGTNLAEHAVRKANEAESASE